MASRVDQDHWVLGQATGLAIPADAAQLNVAGAEFLTRAFHAGGLLPADNRVARILRIQDFSVGGTGAKALVSVAYEQPSEGLPKDLFVKFSRNFADPQRDNLRHMLESEVQFARLARPPQFPIVVPACLFADFHPPSGTGILITERIAYGSGGIEPQYPKCLDYDMPQALEHYSAIVKALAALAGAHRAGRLDSRFDERFPFELTRSLGFERIPHSESALLNRVCRFEDFAARFPGLVPENLSHPDFVARLKEDIPLFLMHEPEIRRHLQGRRDLIALCHWNANIDNAWFWRDAQSALSCGLMDWAQVGQMPVALSILGAFSGAEPELWREHRKEILQCFIDEYASHGGPRTKLTDLSEQLHLVMALTGLAYLMAAPAIILARLPDLADIKSRFDPRLRADETARVQLHMLCMFLNQWETEDFGRTLRRVLSTF